MNFEPVATLADLNTLNPDDILEGYLDYRTGDPEPGPNRGRSYWHGWCNRARDKGDLPADAASRQLAHELWPRGVFAGKITPGGRSHVA